jgi:hypothetical protein
MPIQWNGPVTSQQQLAGVIQGESATPAGQFGVASVMYNRMTIPGSYLGGGSGDITQVVTPTQFNGYNPNASPYANQLASDLWNGNSPSGGSTGNATFFAAPAQGNAAWANPNTSSGQGLFGAGNNQIGGNYFSDQQGPPTSNFQPPQYGGTTQTNTGYPQPPEDSSGNLIGAQNPNYQYTQETINPPDSSGVTASGNPTYADGGAVDQTGSATPIANSTFSGTPLTSLGLGGSTSSSNSGGGAPIVITDATSVASNAGTTIQQGTQKLGESITKTGQAADTTLTSATQSVTSTGTGWLQYIGNLVYDVIPRGGVGIAALVLLLMGLWLLGKQQGKVA